MAEKPRSNSASERELDKAAAQFDAFDQNIKDLTLDRMNETAKPAERAAPEISQKQISNSRDVYLKPMKTISSPDKFNEKYRDEYNHKKEFVYFTASNNELIGASIELWTKPFSGVLAEFWEVPVNRPVWGPRYLAEQIKGCTYHRLSMDETKVVGNSYAGAMTGQIIADNVIQRLDASPASKSKSIFMGSDTGF